MTALPDIPPAVHRPCRVSCGAAVHPGACAPLFQSGHRGCHPAVGGGAVGLSGADGRCARRALDPLHGSGHRVFLPISMGHVEHHSAGSRVSLRTGVILAELAASVEWQLHCALWPARGPWEPLSLLLLALVYGTLFGIMCYLQHRRPSPPGTYRSAAAPP